MIDWKKFVIDNDLTMEEFENEIFNIAACMGVMVIDDTEADTLKVTAQDDIGQIEMTIKRVTH